MTHMKHLLHTVAVATSITGACEEVLLLETPLSLAVTLPEHMWSCAKILTHVRVLELANKK